jgi:hypothetical protein
VRKICLAPPGRMVTLVKSVSRVGFSIRVTLLRGSPVSCVTLEMLVADEAIVETVAGPMFIWVVPIDGCVVAASRYWSGTSIQLVDR